MNKTNLIIIFVILALALGYFFKKGLPTTAQVTAVHSDNTPVTQHSEEKKSVETPTHDFPPAAEEIRAEITLKQSLSPEGRGLVSTTGHPTMAACEDFLWKRHKLQGICRPAGACVCTVPKDCGFGACFVGVDPIEEVKSKSDLIRQLYRGLIGMEPPFDHIKKYKSMECVNMLKEILKMDSVKQRISIRNPQEKIFYLTRALWQREVSQEESMQILKKTKDRDFKDSSYVETIILESETQKLCRH